MRKEKEVFVTVTLKFWVRQLSKDDKYKGRCIVCDARHTACGKFKCPCEMDEYLMLVGRE